jgi:hypothetical protein
VAEVGEPDSGQSCPLEQRLDVTAQEVRPPHRGARHGREQEAVVVPERSLSLLLILLPRAVASAAF